MGLSLADAAVRGTSTGTMTDEARELLDRGDIAGLLRHHKQRFGGYFMGPEDDVDDDGDDDDTDDGDDDGDDDDEDDDDDDDKSKSKKLTAEQRRIQELSAEAKRNRLKAVQRGKELKAAQEELAKLRKGKPAAKKEEDSDKEDEPDETELLELKAKNEELQGRLVRQQLRSEFTDLVTGPKPVVKFKNPKTAFKLLDLDDIEIDDDGDIDGLEDAIKALAKSDPYLVDTGKDKDDDEDEDDEVTARRKRKTGTPTGTRKKANPNREKLVNKYPALRR